MNPNPIKFGTDGWRAIIADDYTFDNVRVCAQGTAEYVKRAGTASRGWSSATTRVSSPQPSPPPWPKSSPQRRSRLPVRQARADARHRLRDPDPQGRGLRRHHLQPQPCRVQRLQGPHGVRRLRPARGAVRDRSARRRRVRRRRPAPALADAKANARHRPDDRPAHAVPRAPGRPRGHPATARGRAERRHRPDVRRRRGVPGASCSPAAQHGSTRSAARSTRPSPACTTRSRSPATSSATAAAVREFGAYVALCTDGDADRVGVLDGAGEFVEPARDVRPARLLPARGARRTRPDGQVGDDDEHDPQARRSLRRPGLRDRRRLQVPRPEDARDRRHHRRRGVRWLRLPGPSPGARRRALRRCTCST